MAGRYETDEEREAVMEALNARLEGSQVVAGQRKDWTKTPEEIAADNARFAKIARREKRLAAGPDDGSDDDGSSDDDEGSQVSGDEKPEDPVPAEQPPLREAVETTGVDQVFGVVDEDPRVKPAFEEVRNHFEGKVNGSYDRHGVVVPELGKMLDENTYVDRTGLWEFRRGMTSETAAELEAKMEALKLARSSVAASGVVPTKRLQILPAPGAAADPRGQGVGAAPGAVAPAVQATGGGAAAEHKTAAQIKAELDASDDA
jgi:hypothetical protein